MRADTDGVVRRLLAIARQASIQLGQLLPGFRLQFGHPLLCRFRGRGCRVFQNRLM